tara:strand:- start:12264 stop:12494 length:231 start_codon:yes stop_codon:yes gene_type:complete
MNQVQMETLMLDLYKVIFEKKKVIKENDHALGWNDQTLAREYRELSVMYDALFNLFELWGIPSWFKTPEKTEVLTK